eukprot:CAMPEP_0198489200 /NCGR_PEP_ID=MMETSP1462-20131121/1294_1 /TAXON_ID=1333877 /ORGANISM="Brandtodinium nutriculum, Strain RCC3387" /LENGTH=286 /DNA_ID=CAMNT_0044217693 /DNA_START=23 /DNA_END=881 /DNA_ORIENTATION=+
MHVKKHVAEFQNIRPPLAEVKLEAARLAHPQTSPARGLQDEGLQKRVVVTAAVAEVLRRLLLQRAEDMVDPSEGHAGEHQRVRCLQTLNGRGRRDRIEVANEDDSVCGLLVGLDDAHNVRSGFFTAPLPATVHAQGPMVIREENDFVVDAPVLQSDPLDGPEPIVLFFFVFRHVLVALGKLLPIGGQISDGECAGTLDPRVRGLHAAVAQHAPHVVALLEAHEIWRGVLDQPARGAPIAVPFAVEVPPEEIVRENLDEHLRLGAGGGVRPGEGAEELLALSAGAPG